MQGRLGYGGGQVLKCDSADGAAERGGGTRFRPVELAPLVVWRSIQAFGDVARPSGRAVQWWSWPGRLAVLRQGLR